MSTKDENIKTEKDLEQLLVKVFESHKKLYDILSKEFKTLEEKQKTFPLKYIAHADFEDHLIAASQLKHRSIQVFKNAAGALSALKEDIDYFEAQVLLYYADAFLKEKFDKVTDLLRNSYLSSNKYLRQLRTLKGKMSPYPETAEKLVRAFESDEVNFRKFQETKNKLKGM